MSLELAEPFIFRTNATAPTRHLSAIFSETHTASQFLSEPYSSLWLSYA